MSSAVITVQRQYYAPSTFSIYMDRSSISSSRHLLALLEVDGREVSLTIAHYRTFLEDLPLEFVEAWDLRLRHIRDALYVLRPHSMSARPHGLGLDS